MKIEQPTLYRQIAPDKVRTGSSISESGASSESSSVSLSSSASFIQQLKGASQSIQDIRPEVVEQARKDLASGSVGTPEDYKQAISALLQEL
jgi:hypothetical protein